MTSPIFPFGFRYIYIDTDLFNITQFNRISYIMGIRKKSVHLHEPVPTKVIMVENPKTQEDNATLIKKLRIVEIVCK